MEGTESTTPERTTRQDGNQAADQTLLMSGKPLHRFVGKEPRCLGIVILIFGCAEVLMGFQLAPLEDESTSYEIYIPFWQGALFLVCGILSIYTEIHPSKKMVTVCLSMYVVSILGIVVSVGFRVHILSHLSDILLYGGRLYRDEIWEDNLTYDQGENWEAHRAGLILGIEGHLFASSLFVSMLLIFLSAIARLALKSTHTQIIFQQIPPPQNEATPN